ncbi:MAG: GNAT family N-acetyltransferase [Proteobacteria bacterium]|nr:GNAT family N-acetyltransferase [Pseudomonadota bacterium]
MSYEQHYLTPLFEPKSIAIIGASETPGSVGLTMVRNMLDTEYKGQLFFVNPKHKTIFGQRSYSSPERIPQRVDLAVICTKTETVPAIIEACGKAGTRNAIVIYGGFSESGAKGATLEQTILQTARRHRMRLLGPDSLGIMRPSSGVNLNFGNVSAKPGSIGLVSQSGALCNAILDWALPNNIGLSSVVSLGTSIDVDFGEALDYLVSDPKTENIFLYIEGIRNARRFMSGLRAAARCKPVLLIKVGRNPVGEEAAHSHSGALLGDDDVFDAALRRSGVVRLASVGQMYATASALFAHFRPRGNRLAIITNGGGPGVMAADHAADIGIPLAKLNPATATQLDQILPAISRRANPIDLIGDADPQRYKATVAACLADDNVDGILVILTPQALTDPTQTARDVTELARQSDKPLVTCWMGEEQVREARLLFKSAGIPTFRTPEPAVELFSHISNYYRNQKLLMQTPAALSHELEPSLDSARLLIETAVDAALLLAEEIGLPVVMKVDSRQIAHKSDYGGVRLNLASLDEVRDAYHDIIVQVKKKRPDATINGISIEPMIIKPHGRELMVGMMQDLIFGPFITLGPGGVGFEFGKSNKERAVALPPLNRFLAADMMRSARSVARLGAIRNMQPVDQEAIEAVLLRLSEMVCELPWLREININPLIVDEHGAVAVDASISIAHLPASAGRYAHMAIHPYPSHMLTHYQSKDGQDVTIRPIRPEDANLEQEFVKGLSAESKYFRFMNTIRELSQGQLIRMTQIDYDREMAFVATIEQGDAELEVGVARYATNPDGESCEFAIVVADSWQGKGLARHLIGVLIDAARTHGKLKYMYGEFLAENRRMIKFVSDLGFVLSIHPDDPGLKRGVLELN